ncbi:MAG TPA: amidase [Acidimicrobiales bacterium]|nr:amidase [Acidimicrobiales bacterium]
MTTFITRCEPSGSGVRLAIKDLIDMEGFPTTAGCRAVADRASPASADAACLAGARAAGARIVGRTNLHELAFGVTGVNPWYGTPVNPLDPTRVPGGSSSGSAVAVANEEADVAYGSDTGGSVRIPSACCGTAGLKTTWGRIPLEGVWPLSPSFDTVGPMARDVRGVEAGMALLEPGFTAAPTDRWRVGRVRVEADPVVDNAVEGVLAATGWEVTPIEMPEWESVSLTGGLLLIAEAWATNRVLAQAHPEGIGQDVLDRLHMGRDASDQVSLAAARTAQALWCSRIDGLLSRFDLLATPTLTILPPVLEDANALLVARCTLPVNLAGVPALALPVPTGGPLPASLQLVAPSNGEETLIAAGLVAEAAAASLANH